MGTKIQTALKVVSINIILILFLIISLEGIFQLIKFKKKIPSFDNFFDTPVAIGHDDLGFILKPNTFAIDKIRKVSFSTNSHGFRRTPEIDSKKATLFFGCSFMFGEGLNDDETIPWIFSKLTDQRAYNFSAPGYAPNHMLAMLENDYFDSTLNREYDNANIVIMLINEHLYRATGAWDPILSDRIGSPRYIIESNTLKRDGNFYDNLGHSIESFLTRNVLIYQKIKWSYLSRRFYSKEYDLFNKILLKLIKRFNKKKYSNIKIIYYGDKDDRLFNSLDSHLRDLNDKGNVSLVGVQDIIPEISTDLLKYQISHNDSHPNQLAASLIANYIAGRLNSEFQ
jgi:hypothetical protein